MYILRHVFKDKLWQGSDFNVRSTVLSQFAMTLWGSRFPGALGAMLIEILPFLRGIGSDLQRALGDDSPKLVPTVMVAYTLTSFLIGIIFFALGFFKAGRIVRLTIHILKIFLQDIDWKQGRIFPENCSHRHHRWYWSLPLYSWARTPASTRLTSTNDFFGGHCPFHR